MSIQLFHLIDQYFLSEHVLDRIEAFTQAECQVEGWFKGELLHALRRMAEHGHIESWDREVVLTGRKKCDFRVEVGGKQIYLELKALYHGRQRGQSVDLGIYLYDDSIGIMPDVRKLAQLPSGEGYCLLFIYPRPDEQRWSELLNRFQGRASPIKLGQTSVVTQYPPQLYVCKLKVERSIGSARTTPLSAGPQGGSP